MKRSALFFTMLLIGNSSAGTQATVSGKLETHLAEDLRAKKAWNEYWVTDATGKSYRIDTSALDPTRLTPGATISVSGPVVDGAIQPTSQSMQVTATGTTSVARARPLDLSSGGLKKIKVALILFNFTDNPTQNYSPATIRNVLYGNTPHVSINNFYQDISGGRVSIVGKVNPTGDVYGWYTIPSTQADCQNQYRNVWRGLATQAAVADGFDPSGYDVVIYNFPTGNVNCLWTGMANVVPIPNTTPSVAPWIFMNGSWTPTYIHEIGHILGLNHANSYSCTDSSGNPTAISSTCVSNEYGDRFDDMGADDYLYFNIRNRDYLGFIPSSYLKEVTASGTYSMKSGNIPTYLASTFQDPYGIRIPLGTTNGGTEFIYYYLESRTNSNWDSTIPTTARTGVTVRFAVNDMTPEQHGNSRSYLIDTHPSTPTFDDAPLQVGEQFVDVDRGLRITYLGPSGNSKSVRVEFLNGPIDCTMRGPSYTLAPSWQIADLGKTAAYSYTVRSNDSGTNCPRRTFSNGVWPSAGVATTYPDHPEVTLVGGGSISGKIVATAPSLTPSNPNLSFVVVNAAAQDMFDQSFTTSNFVFRLPRESCPLVQPIFTLTQSSQTSAAGGSLRFSYTLRNSNPAVCANSSTYEVKITNPYQSSGWTATAVGSSSDFERINVFRGTTFGGQGFTVRAPANATPGVYRFPLEIWDRTYNVHNAVSQSIQFTVQ